MSKRESSSLRFMYNTVPGRMILKLMACRGISKLAGRFMDSALSKCLIPAFIRKNGINMEDYEARDYSCFNEFFCRRIKNGKRPIASEAGELIAPCDGLLSAYRISEDAVLPIKQSTYTINELLGGDSVAEGFKDGICLVFRLCVDNYHRYCYLDDGTKEKNVFIPGELHTVRPIALAALPVFVRNCRVYTVMHTAHFGNVAQIEVGAMLVGKIVNNMEEGSFKRGEEKGRFEYGGSTVVVLLEKDRARIPERLFQNTEKGIETRVRMGQVIGRKAK